MKKISFVFLLIASLFFYRLYYILLYDGIDKYEISILQSYEYEYREHENNKSYLFFANASNSNYSIIGLPIKNKNKGFVFIITESQYMEKIRIKYLPHIDFLITKETFSQIKKEVVLSKEVEEFISLRISNE